MATMKKTVDEFALWEGIWAMDVSIEHRVDQIEVTAFGDLHPSYVPGMVHENYDVHLRCDRRAYELLMAVVQGKAEYDPVRQEVVVRATDTARGAAAGTLPKVNVDAPVRVIVLE